MFSFNIIDKKESTLLAVYDLEKINCSFDFIIFFQNAILYQKKNNIKKLDLCLVKGSVNGFKKYQFLREKENVLENALFRLNNIVIPSIMMFRKYYDNFFLINDRKHADEFFRKYKNFFPKGYNLNCEKRDYINQSIWKNFTPGIVMLKELNNFILVTCGDTFFGIAHPLQCSARWPSSEVLTDLVQS